MFKIQGLGFKNYPKLSRRPIIGSLRGLGHNYKVLGSIRIWDTVHKGFRGNLDLTVQCSLSQGA